VIFDNKTLRAIARERPLTVEQLGDVKGVGAAKLENYGEEMLELVSASTSATSTRLPSGSRK
jgi:superfamily II DNA helicase RecQ